MASLSLLDPKNDLVFKKLFVAAPALLSDLINAIRCDEAPVEVVKILNPRIEPEDLAGKYIMLDILAKDVHGHYYNIEMQVRQHPDWQARSVYYLAKALADQLKSGEPYSRLKPLIGIHLLDFDLFADPRQAVWCFELRDEISQLNAARLEAKQEGEAIILVRLLTKRFGPLTTEVQQRIAQATTEQLEIWTDNILDAPNLTAVFDGH